MLSHLLDTSVYSQPLRKVPLTSVEKRWRQLGDARLCVSVVCEAELLAGIEARASKRLWRAYRDIIESRLKCLDVDRDVARAYSRLYAATAARGRPKPGFDLLIAATAVAHGLIVATCNAKHFMGIAGVRVEDWSIAPAWAGPME